MPSVFTANFADVLSQVAFSMVTEDGSNATIQALRNGTLVESASVPTTHTSNVNFFGFEGILFDRITVSVDSLNRAMLLDNLQTVAAVPEPETWALWLAGLGLVGSLHRRRMS